MRPPKRLTRCDGSGFEPVPRSVKMVGRDPDTDPQAKGCHEQRENNGVKNFSSFPANLLDPPFVATFPQIKGGHSIPPSCGRAAPERDRLPHAG